MSLYYYYFLVVLKLQFWSPCDYGKNKRKKRKSTERDNLFGSFDEYLSYIFPKIGNLKKHEKFDIRLIFSVLPDSFYTNIYNIYYSR